ncbi:hypothetical protein CGRA01v4_09881 [Colletotrichum graminicola]|nr:hypothetical protein CGRA01v4_09881 [Colletotrichum graminicola]
MPDMLTPDRLHAMGILVHLFCGNEGRRALIDTIINFKGA